jgi:vacuolar-type H+-ATPase subunit H
MLQQPFHPAIADDDYASSDYHQQFEAEMGIELGDCKNILAEIDRLEEVILTSPRVPLTGKTVVNEERLLEQLDIIRASLPETLKAAQEILAYKQQIIQAAQQEARELMAEADRHAALVVNELGIIDRAEAQSHQIRQQALAESEQIRQQAIGELERSRKHNIQELERMRQVVSQECQQIQTGADEYADRILSDLQTQLSGMLKTIHQGREHLKIEPISSHKTPTSAS